MKNSGSIILIIKIDYTSLGHEGPGSSKKEWVFPSRKNVDKLMQEIKEGKEDSKLSNVPSISSELACARRYTSGLLSRQQEANITVDKNGLVTDANTRAMTLLKINKDDFLGSEFIDQFFDKEKVTSFFDKCYALGNITGTPLKVITDNGSIIYTICDAMVYRTQIDGMIHGALVAIRPVPQNVYKNYARGLIESSPDLMCTFDRNGIVSDVNEAAIRLTGLQRKHLIGAKFHNFFAVPHLVDIGVKKAFNEGEVKDYRLDLKSRSGDIIPVSFNASIYKDEDGNILGVFAIARDIRDILNKKRI